ncbi:MAG: hypothetical protein GY880_19785 [Planctomycetaceae bacterium]|nr:hypothetical protein [Planctomycetaceae bacterium]MCP4776468.1 hypothetical protein [Planctomycetaceae bacterium]
MNTGQIEESELLAFLASIESGSVKLNPLDEPQSIYAGNVRYSADNGWRITIFNDANEWDYIDLIETTDGRSIDYDRIEQMPQLNAYDPSPEIAWRRYRIPGHMKFRCVLCSRHVKRFPLGDAVCRCDSCRDKTDAG